MDLTVVEKFYNHYHTKRVTSPDLYRNNDTMITVVLPQDLIEYSNASAGHSGFGAGARAVGIRKSVTNATKALEQIFKSVDSLAKFISESECDGPAYVETVRQRHLAGQTPVDPKSLPAKSVDLNKSYGQGTIQSLLSKYKREQVLNDYNTLSVGEFEERYNLIETV